MPLNSEVPYIGDKAVGELAGIESPNVLRAVEPPQRPAPMSAPEVEDSAASVIGPKEQE